MNEKYFVTIIVTCDVVRVLYIGKSEKKAKKIAKEYEDVENYAYCYVDTYNSKLECTFRQGFRRKQ